MLDKKVQDFARKRDVPLAAAGEETGAGRETPSSAAAERRTEGEKATTDKERQKYGEKEKEKSDQALERLRGLRGAEFDRAFAKTAVEEHQKAVHMVRTAREGTQDEELRTLLTEALPHLEEHLTHARDLSKQVAAGEPGQQGQQREERQERQSQPTQGRRSPRR